MPREYADRLFFVEVPKTGLASISMDGIMIPLIYNII